MIFGRPAHHPKKLLRAAVGRVLAPVAVSSVLGLLVLVVWPAVPLVRLPVAAGVVLAGAAVSRSRWGRVEQVWSGVRAEQQVAKTLGGLEAAAVVHGALLGRGDVDHLVLGPAAAVVETKYGRGPVGVVDGRVRAGRRVLGGDPVGQATAAAAAASRKLSVPVRAVVCVSEGWGVAEHGGVVVCGRGQLRAVWGQLPPVLPDPGAARNLAASLPHAAGSGG